MRKAEVSGAAGFRPVDVPYDVIESSRFVSAQSSISYSKQDFARLSQLTVLHLRFLMLFLTPTI